MANVITLIRMPLLVAIVVLLHHPNPSIRLILAPVIAVLIGMDSLDGFVARKRDQTSVLGSVLDIAADRTVEFVLWVVFADINLISLAVPVLVIMRGIFVDAIRSVAPAHGLAPFELMRSNLGRFLVKSPWLRTPYAVVKAVAFILLTMQAAVSVVPPVLNPGGNGLYLAAQIATWLSVLFCLVRGVPVLIEGSAVLAEQDEADEA
jgi:CDP-diacylglycerol---glycerol-3-phosphate 3-phosphatidyltransferase